MEKGFRDPQHLRKNSQSVYTRYEEKWSQGWENICKKAKLLATNTADGCTRNFCLYRDIPGTYCLRPVIVSNLFFQRMKNLNT
jgi:hypothetical protein